MLNICTLHWCGVDNIKYGNQNIVFAGGGEELDWTLSVLFDSMGALSSNIMILLKKHPDHMMLTEMVLLSRVVVEL